jgi:lactoylglutathione lyase
VAKFIHAMIRVQDLERSLDFYRRALTLEPGHRLDFPDFTLVYLKNRESEFELELTFNHARGEPYTHGTGYGHVAVTVADLAGEHERLDRLGFAPTPIKELKREREVLARFFFMTDPDGYKIEVLERSGHYA